MEFGWNQAYLPDQDPDTNLEWLFPEVSLLATTEEERASLFHDSEPSVPKPVFDGRSTAKAAALPSLEDSVAASVEEGFSDWLDMKMDLSLLEDLEGPFTALDDLLRGEVTMGQSLDFLLDPLEGKEASNILSHEDSPAGFSAVPCAAPIDILSPPSTPPSSPEGLVPDLGLYSPDSVSSPNSLFSNPTGSPLPLPQNEAVFTFITPIIQQVAVEDVATTTLAIECPAVNGLSGLTFVIEQPMPEVQLLAVDEKTKKIRKRKSPESTSAGPARKKASAERAPTNKRERKRMQNKDAATRYRVRKRVQADTLLEEEDGLRQVNTELREKKDKLTSEISYLKELMREMFKARGLLK